MRRLKKIMAVALVAAMMTGAAAGCGNDTDGTTEVTTEVVTEETTDMNMEEVTTEEATTEEEFGVETGDKVVDLTFDNDVEGFTTYKNGGEEEISNSDGQLCVTINKVGSLDYADQIYYDGFRLYQNCVYKYSFDVSCDIERTIEWRLQINGGDYHAYVSGKEKIGPEKKTIEAEFTMSEDSDPAPRLVFNMGNFEGDNIDDTAGVSHNIYFDNILLEVTDASKAQKLESVPIPLEVKVNQVGYKTDSTKSVTVNSENAESFDVVDVSNGDVVYIGTLSKVNYDATADEKGKKGDFTEVKTPGTYKIVADDGEESYEFKIEDNVYDDIYKDVVLMLYKQRCGSDLDENIAGDFAHEACHTGEAVVYGTDTKVDVSGGWHDAGDYGRYVVAGAKTVADLLFTYEDSGSAAEDDNVGIPESGNGIPDLLDEARYEIEWMLKMQDSATGGVYHKVTCANFPEEVNAVDETDQLILSPISNTATGDFTAVMAKASIIYGDIDKEFADKCLVAAENAWEYLSAHQGDTGFKNPDGIVTGEYPDNTDKDEYLWAAVELYIATGNDEYKTVVDDILTSISVNNCDLGWATVGAYALYDYAKCDNPSETAKKILLDKVDSFDKIMSKSNMDVAIKDFSWGSNMNVANAGVMMLMANKLSPNEKYVKGAQYQLDYLLGRNAVSYCFVTGYGAVSPTQTHHRPSQVLEETMPGMLVGGPNSGLDESYSKAVLTGYAPARCYVDNSQAYSLNEVTIYWNSPLVYLMGSLK